MAFYACDMGGDYREKHSERERDRSETHSERSRYLQAAELVGGGSDSAGHRVTARETGP